MIDDVIVVGAGLAGLVCARELAGAGARVRLVDVKPKLDRGIHTTGIFVRRTLEDFEFPAGTLGPGIRRVVLHSPGGRVVALESGRDEYRVGRMGQLYTTLLSEAVERGAVWEPGVRYASSARVAGSGESAVWLESGGRRWRMRTRVLVGADGAQSRVARHLGLDANRSWIVGVEEVCEGSAFGRPELHCYLDPDLAPGYIGWVADDGEQTHVGAGGYADRFSPWAALAQLRRRVALTSAFGGLRVIERRGGRIPVNGILERIGCEQGVLIGDAAGAVSPLTAGGLDPCLRLTRLAVRLILMRLAGAPPALLADYSGSMFRRHYRFRLLLRRLLAGVRRPWAAELAVAMLAGPFRPLASRVFFGRGSFPDVELVAGPALPAGVHAFSLNAGSVETADRRLRV